MLSITALGQRSDDVTGMVTNHELLPYVVATLVTQRMMVRTKPTGLARPALRVSSVRRRRAPGAED